MLESCESAQERWGGVHKIIDKWLNERQELLVLYVAIQGLKPFSSRETPVSVKIQAFCQVLMDYCSAGHFEVYEQLIKEAEEFNDGSIELANKHYPRLEFITVIKEAFPKPLTSPKFIVIPITRVPISSPYCIHCAHVELLWQVTSYFF